MRWARSAATLTARPRREVKGGVSLSRQLWAAFGYALYAWVRQVLAALISDLPQVCPGGPGVRDLQEREGLTVEESSES